MFNTTDFNNFFKTEDINAIETKYNGGKAFYKPREGNDKQNTLIIGNIM